MTGITTALSVSYLDGARLRRGLQAGIHRVISRQEYLNKINVFPVPDGDTGTNIAFTLNSVLAGMSRSVEKHVGKLLTVVADSALDGARGNSGAILAQFFQGFSDSAEEQNSLSISAFVAAVKNGAEYARDALAEPKEGTLISVLSDFAGALAEFAAKERHIDFVSLVEHGLNKAEKSLANTPNQLPVLKKAGVVDAGAEGFVDLLRGIFDFMKNGSLRQIPQVDPEELGEYADEAVTVDGDLKHRYCTECIVAGEDIDRRKLREELSALGSSLVLAGSKRKAKIHIHVNDPRSVFDLAQKYGSVSGQKADDMLQQQREAAHTAERGVAVITDSGADIPDSELERLNIHMVPLRVHFGEKSYLDKIALTAEEFYGELRANPVHPKTSQPTPGDFRRQFQFLGSHYDAVVSINLTSRASGTWQAADSAAARAEGAAVEVIDSLNASTGQGLLVMYAAECAQAGLSPKETAAAVRTMIPKTRTWGALRNLTYAVRGGRVPRSKKIVVDLLRLTPVLTVKPDGRVGSGGILFGRNKIVQKLARFVLRKIEPGKTYRLAVGHCNCPDEGEQLLRLLSDGIPQLQGAWLMPAGPALGAHAGPGSLIVGVQEYAAPQTT